LHATQDQFILAPVEEVIMALSDQDLLGSKKFASARINNAVYKTQLSIVYSILGAGNILSSLVNVMELLISVISGISFFAST